jgi:L-fuconolactonase
MIIDAHQHFWQLRRGDYTFPSPDDPVLYRDFMPSDLGRLLDKAGVSATVLVQATDTLAESAFLLEIADPVEFVAGVVAWWDPRDATMLSRIKALPGSHKLVGVRPMLQRWADVSWLIEPDSLSNLSELSKTELVFDALVDARHLPTILKLSDRVPHLKIVINHMGKPWREPSLWPSWLDAMESLARRPNCWVKISGFPFSKGQDQFCPMTELTVRLKQWFGPERLVWGSDWPVAEREGGYSLALNEARRLFTSEEQASVFFGNASTLYSLNTTGRN